MKLSKTQSLNLLGVAQEHWLDAQSRLLAYDRDFQASLRMSDTLKIATILAALATTAVSFVGQPWLPFAVSLLTALVAAAETQYAPTKKTQAHWDCCNKLEAVKRDLITCAIDLDSVKDVSSGTKALNSIGARIGEASRSPVLIEKNDRIRAKELFPSSAMAQIIARHSESSEPEDDDRPDPLGADAPGVVAVGRRKGGR